MNIDEVDVEEVKRRLSEEAQEKCYTAMDISRALLAMGVPEKKCPSIIQAMLNNGLLLTKNAFIFKSASSQFF